MGFIDINEDVSEEYKRFIFTYKDKNIIIEFFSLGEVCYRILKKKNKDRKDTFFAQKKDKFFIEVYDSEMYREDIISKKKYNEEYNSYILQTLDYRFDIVIEKKEIIKVYEETI